MSNLIVCTVNIMVYCCIFVMIAQFQKTIRKFLRDLENPGNKPFFSMKVLENGVKLFV